MNQRGWSLSSFIGFAVILVAFIIIIAFNVIKLNRGALVSDDQNGGIIMEGENNLSSYSDAENAVVDALKGYRADKYGKKDIEGTLIVTISDLISGGYLKKIVLNGSSCTGYGVISKEGSNYNYVSYIKCDDYTTPGYTSSFDR